jgi:hypothetical protein
MRATLAGGIFRLARFATCAKVATGTANAPSAAVTGACRPTSAIARVDLARRATHLTAFAIQRCSEGSALIPSDSWKVVNGK